MTYGGTYIAIINYSFDWVGIEGAELNIAQSRSRSQKLQPRFRTPTCVSREALVRFNSRVGQEPLRLISRRQNSILFSFPFQSRVSFGKCTNVDEKPLEVLNRDYVSHRTTSSIHMSIGVRYSDNPYLQIACSRREDFAT
jgi:hypothetical protein